MLLKPLLCKFGIGKKVFTWSNVFVLVWSGFRGAVSLALGMQACELITNVRVGQLILFHSAGSVAFSLLFNGITMRFFLRRLGICTVLLRTSKRFSMRYFEGILEISLSKMITMHMAMKQILIARRLKIDGLKTDRYLTDANWEKVDELTKLDTERFGISEEGDVN